MNSVNLDNQILEKHDTYTLFEMLLEDKKKFYICLPVGVYQDYQMVIDFPEEYYRSLLKNERLDEVNKKAEVIYQKYPNAIYVLTNITTYDLANVKLENDDHAYQYLLKDIHKYTFTVYKKLSKYDINKMIAILSDTEDDKKLLDWLDINMPNCFEQINYNKLTNVDNTIIVDTKEVVNDTADDTKLVPQTNGFLSVTTIVITTILSFVIGIGTALILIK